jgi:hypothetical protein
MKAEHRKELHTNLLADRMGRILQGVKSGPKNHSLLVWVFAILAVGAFAIWQYLASASYTQRSSLWMEIDHALYEPPETMANSLKELAREHKGTLPARVARFERARLLLQDGLENFVSEKRPEALKKIQEAHDLYAQLANESRNAPLLDQEAMMGVAKAEEALIGTDKPSAEGSTENAATFTLEQAIERYRQLADKYPSSYLGKSAAEHTKELEANREAVVTLYKELNNLAAPKAKPETPPVP